MGALARQTKPAKDSATARYRTISKIFRTRASYQKVAAEIKDYPKLLAMFDGNEKRLFQSEFPEIPYESKYIHSSVSVAILKFSIAIKKIYQQMTSAENTKYHELLAKATDKNIFRLLCLQKLTEVFYDMPDLEVIEESTEGARGVASIVAIALTEELATLNLYNA